VRQALHLELRAPGTYLLTYLPGFAVTASAAGNVLTAADRQTNQWLAVLGSITLPSAAQLLC